MRCGYETVYLLGCPAEVYNPDGDPSERERPKVSLIGLFDVIEFVGYEPAAYVHTPYYNVCTPEGHPDHDLTYEVEQWAFIEQADPKKFVRAMLMERDMASQEEM